MFGKCDSCSKLRILKTQTNFGVERRMCERCCEAADECERLLAPAPNPTSHIKASIRYKIGRKQETKVPGNWLELYANGKMDE